MRRVIGFAVSFGVICYMFYAMMGSDNSVKQAINNSPAMKEQREMLKREGINPDDPDALKKYAEKKAKEIDQYQHSDENLPKEK